VTNQQNNAPVLDHERHLEHWPPGLPTELDYPQTSVYVNLEVSARRYPELPALIFYGAVLSYRQTDSQVCALAGYLQHLGIAKGDRVLLNLQNSPQFILGFYGVLRADAMVVPVNPMSKTDELRHYITDSEATVAIVSQDTLEQILPLVGTSTLKHVIVVTYSDYLPANPADSADLNPPVHIQAPRTQQSHTAVIPWMEAITAAQVPSAHTAGPNDWAALPYTSGSTGWPKGCMHTHASVMATCHMVCNWKTFRPNSVTLATAPFFHVTGLVSSMNAPIFLGRPIVILPRWDALVAARLIERFQCTEWANVPTMVVDLLSHPQAQEHDISSLRYIGGGGAAMPEAVAQLLQERFQLLYVEGYGMTEFMSPTHINPPLRPKKQCLGIPIFDTHARVIDPDTLLPLGPNQSGEIVMAGPQLMLGYWKQDQATQDSLVTIEGRTYFRSGDLGHYDNEGYYFISDRLKRMINAAGLKVWPAEVENFFYQHEAIKECCIIAAPHARKGEIVRLVMVRKPGFDALTAEDMIDWARERMALYKVPSEVQFIDALPRTSSGKIFWRQLQDQAFGRI
jgi:fatty-acyl-CoA synthase